MVSERKSFREFYFPKVSEQEWNDYRWHYKKSIKDLDTLATFLKIKAEIFYKLRKYEKDLNISITPYYLSLIDPENQDDPLRKQCVPSPLEFESTDGMSDPLGEKNNSPVNDVIHKFKDRALFLVTNICPVYCRHCFRREEWKKGEKIKTPAHFKKMIDYVKANSSIKEVIISGGDPLFLSDFLLEFILKELRSIPNVEIIRVASRIPVVLPQRINDSVASIFKKYSPIWFITHFNHPNEVTLEAQYAIDKLISSKVFVLNQSVLLKGVNDNSKTLEELFRKLLKIGVKPYYLFQCDPAKGVSHFRTSVFKGIEIMEQLWGKLSGLAQPTYALDTEGGGKVPLLPNYIVSYKENSLIVRNYEGKFFEYLNPFPEKEELAPVLPFDEKIREKN